MLRLFVVAGAAALIVGWGCGDDAIGPGPDNGVVGGGPGGGGGNTGGTAGGGGDPDAGGPELPTVDPDIPTTDDVPVEPDIVITPCEEEPLEFLCPCEFNTQCASGYCIAVDDPEVAQRCTMTCIDTCPDGWSCKSIAGQADPIFICVPFIDNLCKPCFEHSDCEVPGDLCLELDGGTHCGRSCVDDPTICPTGYTCNDVTVGQTSSSQCVPDTGSCVCGPEIDQLSDPDNCGSCNHVCEYDHAIAGCEEGDCFLLECHAGWVDLNEDWSDGCEYECTATSETDLPDEDTIDADCDGIDGEYARAVFVATFGKANASGTADDPMKTVQGGIDKAVELGKDHVYVAAGTYPGQVEMASGVSVYGGYSGDGLWQRDLNAFETILDNDTIGPSGEIRTVLIHGVTGETVLADVTVTTGNNPTPGGSTYGIWINTVGQSVAVTRCTVVSGNGGPGVSGEGGVPGAPGAVGQPGKTTNDTDCDCNEFDTYGGKGGAPGQATCPSGWGAGGAGADGACHDDKGKSGDAAPSGTPGGPGETEGSDGDPGDDGAHGSGGDPIGIVDVNGLWFGSDGENGADGEDGNGGGGGGSGDGHNGGTFGCAMWGGGGGGGGSGGCLGTGGKKGTAGGGSFAVFVHNGKPLLVDNVLSHKSGGNGGNGGIGGGGGDGKNGGPGGTGHDKAGDGGKGGNGGDGGDGGHGGGGAGGPAFAVYVSGASDPLCSNNLLQPLGTGGLGGIGGDGTGSSGAAGQWGEINLSTPGCPLDPP